METTISKPKRLTEQEITQHYQPLFIQASQEYSLNEELKKKLLEDLSDPKTSKIRILKKFLYNIRDQMDNVELVLFRWVNELEHLPKIQMKQSVLEFVENHFGPGYSVQFYEKKGGVQIGIIVSIFNKENDIVARYYIKIHSNGLRSQHSSSAEAFSVRELFTYKVLELIGNGPEVHFIFRNEKDLYICTADCGFVTHGKIEFLTFKNFKEHEIGKTLLHSLRKGDEKNMEDSNLNSIMGELGSVELLFRLLHLTDWNQGNYGFIIDKDAKKILYTRIVDFLLMYDIEESTISLTNYLKGNGIFKHEDSYEESFKFLFVTREKIKRLELAMKIVSELKLKIAIEEAMKQIHDILKKNSKDYAKIFENLSNDVKLMVQLIDKFVENLCNEIKCKHME